MKRPIFFTALALAAGIASSVSFAQHKPDALLSIDQNRAAVVEKIIAAWGKEIPAAQAESFKQKLSGLRADHLLAANLSGSFDGVLEILSAHEIAQKNTAIPAAQNSPFLGNISQKISDENKAVGEIEQDLVYTPVTPCRLFDTRAGQTSALGILGGVMANQTTRTLAAGGKCGIPATGVRSVFVTFHAYTYNPAVLGVIAFQKTGAPPSGLAATWTGGVWTTGTIISGTLDNGSFDVFVGNGAAMTADMVVDVVGYFQSANRNGDGLRVLASPSGFPNVINGDSSNTIGNSSGLQAGVTVAGGAFNRGGSPDGTTGLYSTIGGGYSNKTGAGDNSNGNYATVSGGLFNTASGSSSTVVGGERNTASGIASTVAGGTDNTASGQNSFAAGQSARATRSGQFVWADSRPAIFDPEALGAWGGPGAQSNTFNVRATGGFWLVSGVNELGAATSGCILAPSGTGWACSSDRALKERIQAIKPREVLERLVAMPVSKWSMIGSQVRQMGPMAQDFYKAFNLGNTDKMINTFDAQGVAFAAIQGLNQKLHGEVAKLAGESKSKDAKISAQGEKISTQGDKISTLEQANEAMQRELSTIKKKLGL